MENKHPYLENKPPGRNLPIGIKMHENIVRKNVFIPSCYVKAKP